jgi:hypothetical protein
MVPAARLAALLAAALLSDALLSGAASAELLAIFTD